MANEDKFLNKLEVLINVFTVEKGDLKILLFRKNTDPFKGYWMLPSSLLFSNETIYDCANDTIKNMVGLDNIYLEQSSIYSNIDRVPNKRIIGFSLIGLVDSIKINFERKEIPGFDSEWFEINEIPKMVGDHDKIIEDAINNLKKELIRSDSLKLLFPSDFTLPELQKLYEEILSKKLDRRNFRKKILNMNIIELTGEKNDTTNGRPANLYRFKEDAGNHQFFEGDL